MEPIPPRNRWDLEIVRNQLLPDSNVNKTETEAPVTPHPRSPALKEAETQIQAASASVAKARTQADENVQVLEDTIARLKAEKQSLQNDLDTARYWNGVYCRRAEEVKKEKEAAVERMQKQEKIVGVAKKIAGFNGHIGYQTWIKTLEELKKTVAESE
ncbi:hypothetical protein LTR37_000449 [Vermiconidia calcicola]|uniref:Uncharacterized protein n=1 Tax=Vermiconidia calcicola TaxID=1690605 RepID=A0ACC3P0E8_9PEZI|nr:hypothetical protein LTR37_000449 [Vermiconidia calcicola]